MKLLLRISQILFQGLRESSGSSGVLPLFYGAEKFFLESVGFDFCLRQADLVTGVEACTAGLNPFDIFGPVSFFKMKC